jgi:hypothetical protein
MRLMTWRAISVRPCRAALGEVEQHELIAGGARPAGRRGLGARHPRHQPAGDGCRQVQWSQVGGVVVSRICLSN